MKYTKRLLISSVFTFFTLSQVSIGSQTVTEKFSSQDHIKLTQQLESDCLPKFEIPQDFARSKSVSPISAWGVFSSFITSLVEPFITDAPVALEAIKKQKEKLNEQGISNYVSNAITSVGEFVIENPLDTVMLTGSAALGWNVADASLVPIAVYSSSCLRNSQTLWSFANSIGNDKELLKFGIYGLAITYAATSLVPVAYALTPSFGPEFQINQKPVTSFSDISTASLPDGKVVAIWTNTIFTEHPQPADNDMYILPDEATSIIGRIFYPNGTAVTGDFNVNVIPVGILHPSSDSPIFSLAALKDGKFVVAWQSDGLSILARTYHASGNPATDPFSVQQNTTGYSFFLPPSIGNLDGKLLIAWTGYRISDPIDILGRAFSPGGTPISDQSIIASTVSSRFPQGNPYVMGLTNRKALVTWCTDAHSDEVGLYGRFISSHGTFRSDEFIIKKPIGLGCPTRGASLLNGSIFVPYMPGDCSYNDARIVNSPTSISIGEEFLIGRAIGGSVSSMATVASLTDGRALAVWNIRTSPEPYVGIGIAMKLFDPRGKSLTDAVPILSARPQGHNPWGTTPWVNSLPGGGAFVAWQEGRTNIMFKNQIVGRAVSFVTPPPPSFVLAPPPTPVLPPPPTPSFVLVPPPTPVLPLPPTPSYVLPPSYRPVLPLTSAASGLVSSFAMLAMSAFTTYHLGYYSGNGEL